jgi:hypothetical protein
MATPAIAAALLFALAAPSVAQTAKTVEVNPVRVYTPTGIAVKTGDKVAITAEGRVTFGSAQIADLGPNGIRWGSRCNAIARSEGRASTWPAEGLNCWSLFARVGAGDPVEIGDSATFTAKSNGQLRLGVNDNYTGDNSGTFTAEVTVTPPGTPTTEPPTGGPGAGGTSADEGGGNAALFVIIGAVVLVGLVVLVLLLRRRRGTDAEAAPEPEPALAPVAAAAAIPEADMDRPEAVPSAPGTMIAPPDPESIDVNIFEVEFINGLQLRVGYNHFPDGTPVNWRVLQDHKPVAVGSFVAQGGGATFHFETASLGLKLEGRDTHPDGADVQFDWSINGVPFRYSVRRDPNC